MKTSLLLFLSALLNFAPNSPAAERRSSEETAIRLGVTAWQEMAADTTRTGHRQLYAEGVSSRVGEWLAPFARWTGERAEPTVAVHGDHGSATFVFSPQGTAHDGRPLKAEAQVTLLWQRLDGLWKITREQLAAPAARMATNDLLK